jgi:hypothetical protein
MKECVPCSVYAIPVTSPGALTAMPRPSSIIVEPTVQKCLTPGVSSGLAIRVDAFAIAARFTQRAEVGDPVKRWA